MVLGLAVGLPHYYHFGDFQNKWGIAKSSIFNGIFHDKPSSERAGYRHGNLIFWQILRSSSVL
jgi:hypothetical protein